MNDQERAAAAAIKIKEAVGIMAGGSGTPNPFAAVGPSETFMNTVVPGSPVSQEQLGELETKMDTAIREGNMQVIGGVLKEFAGLLGPAGRIFQLLS